MSGFSSMNGGVITTDTLNASVSVTTANLTVTTNINVPDIESDNIKVNLIEEKNQSDDMGVTIEDININDQDITNINLIDFKSQNTAHTIGLTAPANMTTSYTLALPSSTPAVNQILSASSVSPFTNLQWRNDIMTLTPSVSRYMFVAKYGNDTTGNGSIAAPFLTLKKALESCAIISISLINPLCIFINPGVYFEDNSAGPIIIPKAGISITSDSPMACFILPINVTLPLMTCNFTTRFMNITFSSNANMPPTAPTASTGSAIVFGGTNNQSNFSSVRIYYFGSAITCGGTTSSYLFDLCTLRGNYIALIIDNSTILLNACSIQGSTTISNFQTPANKGIIVNGSAAIVFFTSGFFAVLDTCFQITNSANCSCRAIEFRNNKDDCIIESASSALFEGCVFKINQSTNDVHIKASGAGTNAKVIACSFDGRNLSGVAIGKSIYVYDQAVVNVVSSSMEYYETALKVGKDDGTNSSDTQLTLSALTTKNNIYYDIEQYGTTLLTMTSGDMDGAKVMISNPANISLWYLDNNPITDNTLNIGKLTNVDTTVFKILNSPDDSENIKLQYLTDIHNTQGLGVINPNSNYPFSLFNLSSNDSLITAVTKDATKISRFALVSDIEPTSDIDSVRGWYIDKTGTFANLAFQYQNSDPSILLKSLYDLMILDGNNEEIIFPVDTSKLIFGSLNDTNLYRESENTLCTDGNLKINGVTTGDRALAMDGNKKIVASNTTSSELGYLEGATSNIQDQLDGKVSITGSTMTGSLIIPLGTATLPALTFTAHLGYGLSIDTSNNDTLTLSTDSMGRVGIDADGIVSIASLGTGVLHADSSGILTSSAVVNGDIANGTISNEKLATISSGNTTHCIVQRDASGNFAANMISLDGTTTNNTDVATKAYVDGAVSSGFDILAAAQVVATANISSLSGTQTVDGFALTVNDRVLLQNQTNAVNNGVWEVQSSTWTRPTDFNTGNTAKRAYVLINEGNVNAGSSWLCATPTAIIGTDNISFDQYSQPVVYTGNNLGLGEGVYKNNSGNVLNFKSLLSSTYLNISNDSDELTIETNATAANNNSTLVARDAYGDFAANVITASLTGAASSNVLKMGDVMTGPLTLDGMGNITQLPLNFSDSQTTTGMFADDNNLSFVTNGSSRLEASNAGVISIKNFTAEGVVHNTDTGALTSSLIVNADIDLSANISDSKLATISTIGKVENTATTATSLNAINTIVSRNNDGNFAAGTITASLNGSANANVLKAGDTMTGALVLPTGSNSIPSLSFNGQTGTGISASSNTLSLSTNGNERISIQSSGTLTINAFTAAGVLHSNTSGNITNSFIVNADIDTNAAIVDSKLATISTAGKVSNTATTATSLSTNNAIVARDASGNFTANTITASSFTGNFVGNVNGYSTGSFIGFRQLTTGTSYTPTTGTKSIVIEMVGGGGGGAAVSRSNTSSRISISSGGGGGAYLKAYITNISSLTSYAYSIGSGGGVGASGGNTTIIIEGTTYTTQGGSAGTSVLNATNGIAITDNTAVSTNGSIVNNNGQVGSIGMAISSSVGCSGSGGDSPFGNGGKSSKLVGAGANGSGYGAGGAGAVATANSSSLNGGSGTQGIIIIYEYY